MSLKDYWSTGLDMDRRIIPSACVSYFIFLGPCSIICAAPMIAILNKRGTESIILKDSIRVMCFKTAMLSIWTYL
jgi:hypothetical protein